MQDTTILWADDEIDLLKPHILFLNEKGYKVTTVTNGNDAVDAFKNGHFDVVFLDENMPGLTGLETLSQIKNVNNDVPIVLITKNEEEYLMEDAIGSKIDDYLIKPVHPKQIQLTIKRLTENKRLVTEKTTMAYQQDFRNLGMILNDNLSYQEWVDVYKKLIYWELELERLEDAGMHEILTLQKAEANTQFCKFIEKNYLNWMANPEAGPTISPQLFKKKVFPRLDGNGPVFFILIDNLRYDQFRIINPILTEYFRLEEEDAYYSILPTATQYARNSIFAGLMPLDMEKRYPGMWQNDEDEGGKNLFEGEFLADQLKRVLRKDIKHSYHKILNIDEGRALNESVQSHPEKDASGPPPKGGPLLALGPRFASHTPGTPRETRAWLHDSSREAERMIHAT